MQAGELALVCMMLLVLLQVLQPAILPSLPLLLLLLLGWVLILCQLTCRMLLLR